MSISGIRFAIGCDVTPGFKESILRDRDIEWRAINSGAGKKREERGQEWAEICYVPSELGRKKKGLEYRYIAVREELVQRVLPGMEDHLALNIQSMMKQLVFGRQWIKKRLKSVRFHIINIPGRIVKGSGSKSFIIRIAHGHPLVNFLNGCRERIMELSYIPSG